MTGGTAEAGRTGGAGKPEEAGKVGKEWATLLSAVASACIFLCFALNWELNRGSFLVVEKSDVLHGLGTLEGALVALALAAVVCALPGFRSYFQFEFSWWQAIAGALVAVFLIYIGAGGDWEATGNFLVQGFVLVFYAAPLIFGLYAVIRHRPVHLVIFSMFTFFIAGGVRNRVMDIPGFVAFGALFLLSIEVGEASVRAWLYVQDGRLAGERMEGFVKHYLANLAGFASLAVGLTLLILNLPPVIGALGMGAVADSLELASIYGIIASAALVLGGLGLLRYLHDRGHTRPAIERARYLRLRLKERFSPEVEEGAYVVEGSETVP